MSKTVSFRCSEELDDYLEEEAKRRMTTKSTVAQMIVAEHFREQKDSGRGNEGESGSSESHPEKGGQSTSGGNGDGGGGGDIEKAFAEYSEHWYKPDGEKNEYAVEHPSGNPDKRKYYKTAKGAAERLITWYG